MQRESFFIGEREFAASKLGAFAANSLIIKLQKIALPILGETMGKDGGKGDVMNMDVGALFKMVSENLNESVMTEIVWPMFKQSQVASVTDNTKIDTQQSMDKVFVDADGLAEFYLLVFEVLKFNFGGFFSKMVAAFGSKSGGQAATALTTAA